MYTSGAPDPQLETHADQRSHPDIALVIRPATSLVVDTGGAASAAYHLPMDLRLSGELNVRALDTSLDRFLFRH